MDYTGIKIIYEDNHLLVVEKPINIPSQADDTGDPDMLSILKRCIKDKYGKPGEVYLGLVHRLDRPVGGVMVFARTSKAASRLSDQIRKRVFIKKYLAVVHGEITGSGRLENFLLKERSTNLVAIVNEGTPGSLEAILDYEPIEYVNEFTLVSILLHTGRPHQIRVQFAGTGHPLAGDRRYGVKDDGCSQIALWAKEIQFKHPVRDELLKFESSPPRHFPWDSFC